MKKVTVVFIFCISAIFAAPALDEDVRKLESNNLGDFNDIKENIPGKIEESTSFTSTPTIEEIGRINRLCIEETKVDEKIVKMVITDHVIPKDSKYPKFLACSYRKQNYLNEKGEIQFQNIIRFLSKYYKREDLRPLEVCGELKQTNRGTDNALNALKCILPKLLPIKEIFDE
ncbi:uncharacterized protein LOC123306394 [Coccinella septempunctata]|uniref:uncharacterized protein LOC123306394 n=1 Tax=Coccinella septempunctata TaxID=41139 RepID=UPI001D07968C|nr:uncharacterized protein LOC123306394 [Coccinella septempunctata]